MRKKSSYRVLDSLSSDNNNDAKNDLEVIMISPIHDENPYSSISFGDREHDIDHNSYQHSTTEHLGKSTTVGTGATTSEAFSPAIEDVANGTVSVLVPPEAHRLNNATWLSCYISLTSTIVGAGFLGAPYALSRAGYLTGIIFFTICALLSCFGLHLLSACAKLGAKPSSFYTVAQMAAPQLSLAIDSSIVVKCIGIATSYLIVVGDSIPMAVEQIDPSSPFTDRLLCVFIGFAIIAPISFLPSLDSLKATSTASGFMILFLASLVVLYALNIQTEDNLLDPCLHVSSDEGCKGAVKAIVADKDTLKVLGIFLFGFSCQQNTFAVVNELRNPSQDRMDSVFFASIGSALALYIVVSLCGYFTYGDLMQSDILQMYPGAYHLNYDNLSEL